MASLANAVYAVVSGEQRPCKFAHRRRGVSMDAREKIEARRICIRSALPCPDHGGRGLLRSEGISFVSHGAAFRRKAQRRVGLYQPADEARTGSDRPD